MCDWHTCKNTDIYTHARTQIHNIFAQRHTCTHILPAPPTANTHKHITSPNVWSLLPPCPFKTLNGPQPPTHYCYTQTHAKVHTTTHTLGPQGRGANLLPAGCLYCSNAATLAGNVNIHKHSIIGSCILMTANISLSMIESFLSTFSSLMNIKLKGFTQNHLANDVKSHKCPSKCYGFEMIEHEVTQCVYAQSVFVCVHCIAAWFGPHFHNAINSM